MLLTILLFSIIFLTHSTDYDTGILRLKNCGFDPKRLLDVGANVGEWTKEMNTIWPNAYIFMIEGNSKHYNDLKQTNFPFEISLVGERIKNVKFYTPVRLFDSRETGNSIYRENSQLFSTNSSTTIKMDTIDNIVKKHNNGPFDLVKIDIQGAEVNALKGSKQTIMKTEVIFAEAQIMNYNQGAPSFFKLHRLLDRYGFALYDIPIMRRNERDMLLQFDVIWVRKSSQLWHQNCTGYPYPSDFLNDKSIDKSEE